MSSQFLPLVVVVLVPLYAGVVYYVLTRVTPKSELMDGKTFDAIAKSQWGPSGTWVLLLFRIGAVLFFSIGAYATQLMMTVTNQFTDWNVILITWYYLFAGLCTILSMCAENINCLKESTNGFINKHGNWIGKILGMVFIVMASDALFITVVNFAILDRSLTFGNLAIHFFNSVFAMCEFSMNSVPVRKSDIVFVIGWVYLFIVHVWIAVATGAEYPYEFLECSSPTAVLMYLGLLLVCATFFLILYKISQYVKRGIHGDSHVEISGDDDIENKLFHSLVKVSVTGEDL